MQFPSRAEKIMATVEYDTNGGCWLWSNVANQDGYGHCFHAGQLTLAHRASYEEFRGPIPPGMCVCHHCDVRACVNPDHLFVGDATANNHDMIRKGRFWVPVGEASVKAKLTDAQATEIRCRVANGEKRKDLADEMGVSYWAVCDIVSWRKFKHLRTIQ